MPKKEIITIIPSNKNNLDDLLKQQDYLNTKTQAQKNSEVLINILDTLEKMTDMMKDIHLNNIKIYKYIKEQQEAKKDGWFY